MASALCPNPLPVMERMPSISSSIFLDDTVNSVFYGNANASSANFIGGPALLVPEPAENGFIIFVR